MAFFYFEILPCNPPRCSSTQTEQEPLVDIEIFKSGGSWGWRLQSSRGLYSTVYTGPPLSVLRGFLALFFAWVVPNGCEGSSSWVPCPKERKPLSINELNAQQHLTTHLTSSAINYCLIRKFPNSNNRNFAKLHWRNKKKNTYALFI